MTALEYYNAVKTEMWRTDTPHDDVWIANWSYLLVIGFMNELADEVGKRKLSTAHDVLSIVELQNAKWNELTIMFSQRHGISPIRKGGFARAWEQIRQDNDKKEEAPPA